MPSLFQFFSCKKTILFLIFFSTMISLAHAEVNVEQLFTTLNLTEAEKKQLAKGKVVKRVPKEHSDQELAVSFAFKIKENPEQVYKFFVDSKSLGKNKNITGHMFIQSAEDFSQIKFNGKEIQDLVKLIDVKPSEKNNLSNDEITSFQQLKKNNSGKVDNELVVKQFQKLLSKRYQDYLLKGVSGISPYQRNKNDAYDLGQFFRKINQEISPKLKQLFPRFFNMSLNYPNNKPEGLHERYIFLKLSLQDRPAFALEHRLSIQEQGNYLMASRYFYVSHTLNGQQQMGMLLPSDKEAIAISIVRASTDEITGFGQASKQLIGRTMLWKELSGFYKNVQETYEH